MRTCEKCDIFEGKRYLKCAACHHANNPQCRYPEDCPPCLDCEAADAAESAPSPMQRVAVALGLPPDADVGTVEERARENAESANQRDAAYHVLGKFMRQTRSNGNVTTLSLRGALRRAAAEYGVDLDKCEAMGPGNPIRKTCNGCRKEPVCVIMSDPLSCPVYDPERPCAAMEAKSEGL